MVYRRSIHPQARDYSRISFIRCDINLKTKSKLRWRPTVLTLAGRSRKNWGTCTQIAQSSLCWTVINLKFDIGPPTWKLGIGAYPFWSIIISPVGTWLRSYCNPNGRWTHDNGQDGPIVLVVLQMIGALCSIHLCREHAYSSWNSIVTQKITYVRALTQKFYNRIW